MNVLIILVLLFNIYLFNLIKSNLQFNKIIKYLSCIIIYLIIIELIFVVNNNVIKFCLFLLIPIIYFILNKKRIIININKKIPILLFLFKIYKYIYFIALSIFFILYVIMYISDIQNAYYVNKVVNIKKEDIDISNINKGILSIHNTITPFTEKTLYNQAKSENNGVLVALINYNLLNFQYSYNTKKEFLGVFYTNKFKKELLNLLEIYNKGNIEKTRVYLSYKFLFDEISESETKNLLNIIKSISNYNNYYSYNAQEHNIIRQYEINKYSNNNLGFIECKGKVYLINDYILQSIEKSSEIKDNKNCYYRFNLIENIEDKK